jgi:hypothetical protein
VAELGEIDTAVPAVTVTVADAVFVGSAMLVAVTVTTVFELTWGAVKRPEDEMLPSDADQVTTVFDVPVIAAVNCCCAPVKSVGELGEMKIVIVEDGEEDTLT